MKSIFVLCVMVALGNAIWVREMENPGLYQGDMKMRPDQIKAIKGKGNAFGSIINFRWPNGVVPYYIDWSIGNDGANAVNQAIADYHKFTCLKFVKQTNEREYIHFTNGGGCSSPVGYNNPEYTSNGVNQVELGPGCRTKGTAMHEIGHSIGLYHEQSRPDRDNFVTVNTNNLYDPTMAYNFYKYGYGLINSLGFTYDYDSMMHYKSTAFGCDNWGQNCKVTIVTKDRSKQNTIGWGNGFSQGDIAQINKMYGCKGTGGTGTGSGDCVDKDNECEYFAKIGECSKNPIWMLPNCKKSCAQVNGDLDNDCAYFARIGECKKNPTWMHANCKKSCNVC